MKFAPLLYKMESIVPYIHYMNGQNFTEILSGTHRDVALSRRIKSLLSSSSPLIHVLPLPLVFRGKGSHCLASCDVGILK